jgi:hypothetical protein
LKKSKEQNHKAVVFFVLLSSLSCLLACGGGEGGKGKACNEIGVFSETACWRLQFDVNAFLGVSSGGNSIGEPDPFVGFRDDPYENVEGRISKLTTVNLAPDDQWAVWFVQHGLTDDDADTLDLSAYRGGYLEFWVKSPIDLVLGIRSGDVPAGMETSKICLSGLASFTPDDTWQFITVPLSLLEGGYPKADLSQIKVFFVIGSTSELSGATNGDVSFWVDDVRWVKPPDEPVEEPDYQDDCDIGGGICPTFIQPPSGYTEPKQPFVLDVADQSLAAKITIPVTNALVRSDVPIYGVAGGRQFQSYRVAYGAGINPRSWHTIEQSNTPQHRTTVGLRKMAEMQGDVHLKGNLATWNVGLKNWSHLPWHPPEDQTDLNGIYTIKLMVTGQDGSVVEDSVSIEVGRVVANAMPGTAVSADGRAVLRFPEHALHQSFRVFSILPVEDYPKTIEVESGEARRLGPAYRIREPAERFAAEVSLEMLPASGSKPCQEPCRIMIGRWQGESRQWELLDTDRITENRIPSPVFQSKLTRLPSPQAVFALFQVPGKATTTKKAQQTLKRAVAHPSDTSCVKNNFEGHQGGWKKPLLDRGPVLRREQGIAGRDSHALKIASEGEDCGLLVTICDRPFDLKRYPLMQFDYCTVPEMKAAFYFRVNNRWYQMNFTDDPQDFRNRDVNIDGMGAIEGVTTDGKWQTARVNLLQSLRSRTRHTVTDKVIIADWNVTGFMKLEPGKMPPTAWLVIDDFEIGVDNKLPSAELPKDPGSPLALRREEMINWGSISSDGVKNCRFSPVEMNETNGSSRLGSLSYAIEPGPFHCEGWMQFEEIDLNEMSELNFFIYAKKTVPKLHIGLGSGNGDATLVPVSAYQLADTHGDGAHFSIPISAFFTRGFPSQANLGRLSMAIWEPGESVRGTIALEGVSFSRNSTLATIADFRRLPMYVNLLGGRYRTRQENAAAIHAGYHRESPQNRDNGGGALRISYGGTIGKDYGQGRFSYSVWETDLMGFDARPYTFLSMEIRGEKGGERPNIYLDDGNVRRCARPREYGSIRKEWDVMRIPLHLFSGQGVDLSHLKALQLDFEWVPMSGTIYLGSIAFDHRIE